MGLLKWLKRDREFSPTSKRRLSEPPLFGNKVKVSRNESYLNALAKFNKWRQAHLLSQPNAERPNYVNSPQQAKLQCIGNDETLDSSQMLYEEINIHSPVCNSIPNIESCVGNSTQGVSDMDATRAFLTDETARINCWETGSWPICENGDFSDVQTDQEKNTNEEPEYALPFSTSITEFDETIFQNYIEQNFEFLNQSYFQVHNEQNSTGKVITDLDKSQVSLSQPNSSCVKENISSFSWTANQEVFSEYIVCPLTCIKESINELGFDVANGYIQHGEIDSVKISYFQINERNLKGVYNNFETLRQLRHPNILLLMGVSLSDCSELKALIIEPLQCSLYDKLHTHKTKLSLGICYQYTVQIVDAIIYLHRHKFIHSNIFSQNIYISSVSDVLKLGGFELNTVHGNNVTESEAASKHSWPLLIEYRRRYSKHNYQAPELLLNTNGQIKPLIQSDVYGVCITLWEMLNCAVPYSQFSYHELVKVFSLKNAQLPVFEKDRFSPFKFVLEKGLDIQVGNRFQTVVLLKEALQQVQLGTQSYISEFRQLNEFSYNPSLNDLTKAINNGIELPYERTSTIKNRKRTNKTNRSRPKSCDWSRDDEFNLLPNYRTNKFGWDPSQNSKDKAKRIPETISTDTNRLQTHEFVTTPNKKYSVNILIRSRCSPTLTTEIQESGNESSCKNLSSISIRANHVKEKVNKFESFSSTSPIPYASREMLTQNNAKKLSSPKEDRACLECNSCESNTEREYAGSPVKKQLITTQDIYIDDDLSSSSELGSHFMLNLNYVPNHVTSKR